MSIYKGSSLIAGGRQCMPLLSFMWADHILNDVSWLRADTFSWQSGAVYQAAYQHLVNDIPAEVIAITVLVLSTPIVYERYTDGDVSGASHPYCWQIMSGTAKTYTDSETPSVGDFTYMTAQATQKDSSINSIVLPSETETIAGTTITYYTADDGHKLVLPDQESNVEAIYAATGVAWYYILDTTNQRFKLPRTKFGFTGIRSGVGKYVEAGLPNITGTFYRNAFNGSSGYSQNSISGAFTSTNANGNHAGGGGVSNSAGVITLDASRSSSVYGNSDTVQPKATEMYLYFYVGNFTQTALENTAGITAETLNDKLDLDAGNATSATKQTVGGWCMPDYTTGVSKSWDTSYLADSDTMICYQTNHQSGNPNVEPQVSQDGSTWITLYGQNAGGSNFKIGGWFFCPKGWYWKMVGGRNVDRMLTAYSMKSAT